eukprot:1141136-Pelagomonas_calceolata.AAC.6
MPIPPSRFQSSNLRPQALDGSNKVRPWHTDDRGRVHWATQGQANKSAQKPIGTLYSPTGSGTERAQLCCTQAYSNKSSSVQAEQISFIWKMSH